MQVVLSDHNCEGQAKAIFDALRYDGTWLKLVPMTLKWFRDIGLPISTDDEMIWRLCQEQGYLLLTGNRSSDDGEKSLEFTIHRLITPDSLPVLTLSNLKRVMSDPIYCKRCAERLAEIVHDLHDYRGLMRVYLP